MRQMSRMAGIALAVALSVACNSSGPSGAADAVDAAKGPEEPGDSRGPGADESRASDECMAGSVQCASCCPPGEYVCDKEGHCCLPDCSGRHCGDDGCDGSCGTCPPGVLCVAGSCGGCTPDCEGKQCGPDGCGGYCGICEEGLECLYTKFGPRCSMECELFTCPEGQFCLFGLCVAKECDDDDDCGGGPAHYCDKLLQCRSRKACQASADCKMHNKTPYCDQGTGFCMENGNCWEDSDCPGGSCGEDHWCTGHNCSLLDAPGCPPHLPICDMPTGDAPLCDGLPCGSCVAPCTFDTDCPAGKECSAGDCFVPGNDCILDSDCAQGQYCSPGCVPLKPTCTTEADCGEGQLCLAGFCFKHQVVPCESDALCAAWMEGYECSDNVCKPEEVCVLDSQCPPGEYCHSICMAVPQLPDCTNDAGCPDGQICESEECQSPPECRYSFQCPAGHVCSGKHCYNNAGVCAWLKKGSGFCADGDPCTVDSCDSVTGCVHEPGACD